MSFKYRSEKRKRAHFVLEYLSKDNWNKFHAGIKGNDYVHLSTFFVPSTNDFESWIFTLNTLVNNNHIIQEHPDKSVYTKIRILPAGIDAYKESYYLKEIQKDRLESIELYTKWILPILSTVISLIALFVSLSKK